MTDTATDVRIGHRLGARKRIALIAHDNRKADLLAWARFNRGTLASTSCWRPVRPGADRRRARSPVHRFLSGPLGGDQQVGAAIAEGRIDAVMFFWDPLEPHPHDVDVKALLRVAVVHNIAIACNRATADFVLSSPLMNQEYAPSFTAEGEETTEAGPGPNSATEDARAAPEPRFGLARAVRRQPRAPGRVSSRPGPVARSRAGRGGRRRRPLAAPAGRAAPARRAPRERRG